MECNHFNHLKQVIDLDPGDESIPRLLKKVLEQSSPKLRQSGLELLLCRTHMRPNKAILDLIFEHMPANQYKMQRSLILRCLPAPLTLYPELCNHIANHVTDILLQPSEEDFCDARDNFGKFIQQVPILVLREENSPLLNKFSDADKLAVLYYLEEFIKPNFDDDCLRLSNRMFVVMAKKLPSELFNKFFKCLMKSENYSYYNVMASLTDRAKNGELTAEKALSFMENKKTENTTRSIFGRITPVVKRKITFNFVNEIFKTSNCEQIDMFLHGIRRGEHMTSIALQEILKKQYDRLDDELTENMSLSSRLQNLASRSVLTFKSNISEKRHEILIEALELEDKYSEMSAIEKKLYFAVLATQSYPKKYCQAFGSDALFKILAKRLFKIAQSEVATEIEIDLNEFSNILYCMFNLYRINHRLKRLFRAIHPRWRSFLVNLLNLHKNTTNNLRYAKTQEENEEKKLRLKRTDQILLRTGVILEYLFGQLKGKRGTVTPHYWGDQLIFKDYLFTDSFNTQFMAELTIRQTCPGPPVKKYADGNSAIVERSGAGDDAEWDESDDDADDEGEDSDDDATEESTEEESEEETVEAEEAEKPEEPLPDGLQLLSEGESDWHYDEEYSYEEEEVDDEVGENNEGSTVPASTPLAAMHHLGTVEAVADFGTSDLDKFVDDIFSDPNMNVQTPDMSEQLANSAKIELDEFETAKAFESLAHSFDPSAPSWAGSFVETTEMVPPVVEPPQQRWRDYYGLPNGFTAEEMAKYPSDIPIALDPTMQGEGPSDPNEWGNIENIEERRFLFGDKADAVKF